MKADEGTVACRGDLPRQSIATAGAGRRLKDGGERGIQLGGGLPRVFYGGLGLQVLHGFQRLIFRMRKNVTIPGPFHGQMLSYLFGK